jgi:hypothetical protein
MDFENIEMISKIKQLLNSDNKDKKNEIFSPVKKTNFKLLKKK